MFAADVATYMIAAIAPKKSRFAGRIFIVFILECQGPFFIRFTA